jgi:excisionase family DNA binding protein
MKEESQKKFSSDEARAEYYKLQDTKTKDEYFEEKYGLGKDVFNIKIADPQLTEYIKDQAKLNKISNNEYVTKILNFEKEENEFILNDVSEELEALENGTLDTKTLSSARDLLDYLEKTDPENILGDYAKEHNYGIYESLHEIVNEHKEMKLLIQYDNAELTTGQVAEKLGISKSEVLDLLVKHKIPYVRADEEYLEQEFKTIQKYIK